MTKPLASPPPSPLAPPVLAKLSNLIAAQLGLHYPPERWADLERGFRPAARDLGFEEPEGCVQWLASAPLNRRQVQTLAAHLTIGETYFFRERGSFQALEERVLPDLIAARRGSQPGKRQLRIWSAACCTGEETYSLAISVTRVLGELSEWDVTILGTDINPRFLEKAVAGVYGEWSFRDTAPAIRARYFREKGRGRFEVVPEIRRLVHFEYQNLADDCPSPRNGPGSIDVLFCRNVLIYLESHQAARLALKLSRCLAEGGWLFVGASETSQVLFGHLTTTHFPGAIVYRKPPAGAARHSTRHAPALAPVKLSPARPPPSTPKPAGTRPEKAKEEPEKAVAAATLCRACANRGDLPQALDWCEKALADDKLSPDLQYLKGTILQETGDWAGAAASFKRSLYLDPAFVMSHLALGHLARGRGNRREATRHLRQAMGLLRGLHPDERVPESDGLTAARLADFIAPMLDESTLDKETA